jgi:uncharacterized protein YutE (UPF0331/DUF86 family)
MGELLLSKLLACRQRIAKLRAALPPAPEEITRDERLEAYLSFHLFLLIQDTVDIAAHLIAARGLGIPASLRDSFVILAKEKILTTETASAMGALTALRNRIAHSYGELDPVRMAREAPHGLAEVERFLEQVTAALPSS